MQPHTVRATADALGPGSPGPWGYGGVRNVKATAAAVVPGAVRGAWGRMVLGRARGVFNVIRDKSLKYEQQTQIRDSLKTQVLTGNLYALSIFHQTVK